MLSRVSFSMARICAGASKKMSNRGFCNPFEPDLRWPSTCQDDLSCRGISGGEPNRDEQRRKGQGRRVHLNLKRITRRGIRDGRGRREGRGGGAVVFERRCDRQVVIAAYLLAPASEIKVLPPGSELSALHGLGLE